MVNFQSGLLGISETSSDMQDLLECEAKDIRAAEALALFCYQVKKRIRAFAAALGGVDTLVFWGGIGENAPQVRARICDGLGFLGIEFEEKRNMANVAVVSTEASRLTYRRANHDNIHVRGFKEEGITTIPFDRVVLNELDRFHLVGDVIDRMPILGSRTAYAKQYLRDKLLDHKAYIDKYGQDMPEIRNWKWSLDKAGKHV
ncbi:MAG: hypothetical protein WAV05_12270 [Anaerolineales bacterium]